MYRNFGSVEVTDTVSVTASLQELLPYVNPSLTGLWGWSYGGFLTLSALSKDKEGVIKCGTSVAPVVKWELYDTVYTERYMSTPQVGEELQDPGVGQLGGGEDLPGAALRQGLLQQGLQVDGHGGLGHIPHLAGQL